MALRLHETSWRRVTGSYGRTVRWEVKCTCGYRRSFYDDWRAQEDADRHQGAH